MVTDKHRSLWPYPAERPENPPHDHCNTCVAGKAGQHEAKGQQIGIFACDCETFRERELCYRGIVRDFMPMSRT